MREISRVQRPKKIVACLSFHVLTVLSSTQQETGKLSKHYLIFFPVPNLSHANSLRLDTVVNIPFC